MELKTQTGFGCRVENFRQQGTDFPVRVAAVVERVFRALMEVSLERKVSMQSFARYANAIYQTAHEQSRPGH
jgi:hypothetical protein